MLSCPLCCEVMTDGNILQCSNGHVLCEACKRKCDKTKGCPTCKVVFLGDIRVRVLEDLRDTALQIPCPHATDLCQFVGIRSELRSHTIDCPDVKTACPYSSCDKRLSDKEFVKHLLTCCPDRCDVIVNLGEFKLDKMAAVEITRITPKTPQHGAPFEHFAFQADGVDFVIEFSKFTESDSKAMWVRVYACCPVSKAATYRVRMVIGDSDKDFIGVSKRLSAFRTVYSDTKETAWFMCMDDSVFHFDKWFAAYDNKIPVSLSVWKTEC